MFLDDASRKWCIVLNHQKGDKMGRKYKFPIFSRIACKLQWIVPKRTLVWFALAVLDELDTKMKSVEIHDKDGGITLCDAIDAIQLENYKRLLIRKYLKGVIENGKTVRVHSDNHPPQSA